MTKISQALLVVRINCSFINTFLILYVYQVVRHGQKDAYYMDICRGVREENNMQGCYKIFYSRELKA